MDKDETLQYLTQQIDLLQSRAAELQGQHDEIEKQLRAYMQLVRMYRGVYESEAGVGLQNRLPSQIIEILERKFADEEVSLQKKVKKKTKRCKKTK